MKSIQDIEGHRFISTVNKMDNIPQLLWLETHIPQNQIYFWASDFVSIKEAALNHMGIAPLVNWAIPQDTQLIPLFAPPETWSTKLWLVTHRDIHRTAKVQAFTQFLKKQLKGQ